MADIIHFDPKQSEQPDQHTKSPSENKKGFWKQRKPHKKQTHLIVKILIVVVILLIGLYWFVNRDRLTPDRIGEWMNSAFATMGHGDGYPVNIDGTKAYALEPMGDEIAVLTDTAFQVFNDTAKEVVKEQHGFSHPAMRVTEDRALLFDRGGTTYRITAKSGTLHEDQTESAILCAAIGKSGVYAIATKSQGGYIAELRAYNDQYEEIFKWSSSQQIVDLAVSPDGTKAAAILLNTKEGALVSTIAAIDFSTGEIVNQEISDTLLTAVAYCGDRIMAVGDNCCVSLNIEGEDLKEASLHEGYLAGYHFSDSGIAVAVSPYEDRRDCVLSLLNTNCESVLTEELHAQVSSLCSGANWAVVLTEDSVLLVEKDKGVTQTLEASGNYVLERRGKAYVLYGTRIEQLNLA